MSRVAKSQMRCADESCENQKWIFIFFSIPISTYLARYQGLGGRCGSRVLGGRLAELWAFASGGGFSSSFDGHFAVSAFGASIEEFSRA
jgi:hypothetical protein